MIKGINILDLIILLGAIQGIIFSIYLWINDLKNEKASKFLSIFILTFSASSIYYTLETLGLRGSLNAWDFSPLYCSLLLVTAFHFFIRFLVNPEGKLAVWEKLLFIPALLQIGFQLWGLFWVFRDHSFLVTNQFTIYEVYNFFDILTLAMGISFLVASIYKIRKYNQTLENSYAEIVDFSLSWLNKLLFLLIGIWILFAIPNIYEMLSGNSSFSMYYPLWIASSALIYWIGYSTYFKRRSIAPEIFVESNPKTVPKLSSNTQQYHQQLLHLMEQDRPYLNQDLNLKQLAEKLDLSSGYLSQIINEYEGKNFFEYINSYRVEAVKNKIDDPAFNHLNLLGIAFESGFKSKSTFNLAFKKITGMTPSGYKKSKN